jgi:hypothetical protein
LADREEIILPFPEPPEKLGRATHVRSTLLASSMQSLRERGLFERYRELLPGQLRQELLNSIAGEWLPLDRGAAHYTACNELGLTLDEQIAMGRDVSKRVHNTFLGLVTKMARGFGVTPWLLLPRGNTLYDRLFRGGGTQVTKVGPNEVRVDIMGLQLMDIAYFRNAILGMYEAGVGLFGARVHVHALASGRSAGTLTTLRIRWVDARASDL